MSNSKTMEIDISEYKHYWEHSKYVLVKMEPINDLHYYVMKINLDPEFSANKLFYSIIEDDDDAQFVINKMLEHNCRVYDTIEELRAEVGKDFPNKPIYNWPFEK